MKTNRRHLIAALGLVLGPASAAPALAAPEPKPYTLFLGADLDIQRDQEFCRVEGVEGDLLVAQVKGKLESVSTTTGPINLRVQRTVKVGGALVTVAHLKADRVYTAANDPVRKFMRQQPGMAGQQLYDNAQGRAIQYAANASLGDQNSPLHASIVAAARAEQDKAVVAAGDMSQPLNTIDDYTLKMQEELARKEFDAVEITFDAAAPALVSKPYVVIIAEYHDPAEAAGTVHNWIYAKTLSPIDQTPRAVKITKGGFPKGFELQKLELHLYDRGRELATSVAERQMPLTQDEAFQFMLADYLAGHKDANVPATVALARPPADLRTRLSGDQLNHTFYVKVTKDGLPADAYVDPSCLQKLDDPYLRAVVQDLRFLPALEHGRAADGVALLKFSSLR